MTGEGRRVRLSSEARREQLLAIGVDMLRNRRLEDLSIDDIANQAGISRGLLFHYFQSMQEFQIAVARRVMEGLIDRLTSGADESLSPDQRLRSSLSIYIDYIAERPDVYRSVVRGVATGPHGIRTMADHTRDQVVDLLLANASASAPGAGAIEGPSARLGAHAWIAMTEELVARWLDDPVISRDELVSRIVAPLPALLGVADRRTPTS
ncbi:TetR/AcrR family transcriptional regulator [Cumulibacter manganitolerans]|uniref:TetR/AcrR family transcriptional regulator n=1 Tax=Cumulibacter manganitolerans TaxID=1884992 RepID=UPI0012967FB4|nr:TetR/AcrR family transcriptional regulator [Cumulibacter manganitolerans]